MFRDVPCFGFYRRPRAFGSVSCQCYDWSLKKAEEVGASDDTSFFLSFYLSFFLSLFLSLPLSPYLPSSLFSATSRPFLSSLPFFFSRTRHRGCRAKARRRARNILAQLCFAPDDSQHYRSLGVDASFFLPYPGIPILLHTLSILILLPFSFNSKKTIFVKLTTLTNS